MKLDYSIIDKLKRKMNRVNLYRSNLHLLFDRCADKSLHTDAQDHLAAYTNGIKNGEKQSKNNYDLKNDKIFHNLPCELLVIGEGMDDYVEQYLLSIRSGRIYLAIHNIPEWKLIGTFADWICLGIENAHDMVEDIQNQHDEI